MPSLLDAVKTTQHVGHVEVFVGHGRLKELLEAVVVCHGYSLKVPVESVDVEIVVASPDLSV